MDRRDSSLWIAFLVLVLHLITATGYGIFRDELYYLACADHLAWGYVDHPPLSVALLDVWRGIFGDGLVALRLPSALLHAFAVFATGQIAAAMGARGIGRALAALCTGLAPGLLGMTSFYSMNAIDLALWTALTWIAVRILLQPSPRAWILFGVVLGLGLLNKVSIGMLGAGLAVGLLFSSSRGVYATRWPYLVGLIAAGIFAPHVVWQMVHDWPTREFIENAQRYKIAETSPAGFMMQSWLEMLPPTIQVWLVGLVGLLFVRRLRVFRALGIAWLVVLAILLMRTSKPYYLNAAYPMLFAAGGACWTFLADRRWGRWLAGAAFVGIASSGLFLSPYAIPLLSPEGFVRFKDFVGIDPSAAENAELGALPQHFADRFGWEELTATVARVYESLPPEDQASCLIVADNYGEAGALLHFGSAYALPRATSQHNSFYLWGPGGETFDVTIIVGQSEESLRQVFDSVEEAARHDHPWAMPFECNLPIFVCRGWKVPLAEAWEWGKSYI